MAAAGATMASLAGCTTAVGSVAPPVVPEGRLEEGGWTQVDERQRTVFERQFLGQSVEAKSHTLVFSDTALRESIREKTLGNVDSQVSVVSASHIDFSADIDELPGVRGEILSRTEAAARSQFESRMESVGLTDIERTGTGTLEVDTGESASLTRYAAAFPIESFDVALPDDQSLTVDGGTLSVTGDLAVWHHQDYVLVAGGVYPGENFSRSLSKDLSDAITVDVEVDLGLKPDTYRDEVRGILTAVE